MMILGDAEIGVLQADFGKMSAGATTFMLDQLEGGADRLARRWAANARQTSGRHGRHYPDSIDWEYVPGFDIEIEVGPNPIFAQGGMSFEEGSRNQPAHLDGQRAGDEELPKLERRVTRSFDAYANRYGL
jgi:hypothetical protein